MRVDVGIARGVGIAVVGGVLLLFHGRLGYSHLTRPVAIASYDGLVVVVAAGQ